MIDGSTPGTIYIHHAGKEKGGTYRAMWSGNVERLKEVTSEITFNGKTGLRNCKPGVIQQY